MSETVGVAGCGRMGAPMLAALRKAGIPARGFDCVAGRGDDRPLASFAKNLTTLMTVVRDTDETDALLFDDQALASSPSLRTIIICSTLSPRFVTGLRARVPDHIHLIDAPMSGAQIRATNGTLTFMTGGDISNHRYLFDAMGTQTHEMGELGAGMTAKVLNNLLAASATAMTRLVLDWADAAGMDEAKLLALIDASSGQNWLASGFDEIEFARHGYGHDNSIGILVKDVAAGRTIAPEGADHALPVAVQNALRLLKPRS